MKISKFEVYELNNSQPVFSAEYRDGAEYSSNLVFEEFEKAKKENRFALFINAKGEHFYFDPEKVSRLYFTFDVMDNITE